MNLRNLAMMMKVLATASGLIGCGSSNGAAPDPSMHARARERLLVGDSCPEKQIVHEQPEQMTYVLAGCDMMMKFKVSCQGNDCVPQRLSASRLEQPQRLRPIAANKKVWADPAARAQDGGAGGRAAADASNGPVAVKAGRRVTDISRPPHRPELPREMNVDGMLVWGLYKICVTAAGDVNRVEVLDSALPGGLDGAWIAKIETWRYEPYQVDGRAVPFCHPARLEVRARSSS